MAESSDITQFDFDLPARQIARRPANERSHSRLLIVDDQPGRFRESAFADLCSVLHPGDLLVCNDTRVIPARIQALKPTGGRVEILVERIVSANRIWAQAKARKPLKVGDIIVVSERFTLEVKQRRRDLFVFDLLGDHDSWQMIHSCGTVPLPPYIDREADLEDAVRYQTVYAKTPGSVAAPTAGLHFSEQLIDTVADHGVDIGYLTLHVGAGTFAPIRDGNLQNHQLHKEQYEIPSQLCEQIQNCKTNGGRVVAVGTTVVRALEHAMTENLLLDPSSGETSLFIKPGFPFKVIDALITNFHLPRSTLLMLVCAFGGTSRVLAAYRHGVSNRFRFYSYGDAMYITPEHKNAP